MGIPKDFEFNKDNLDFLKDLDLQSGGIMPDALDPTNAKKRKKAIKVKHKQALTWLMKAIEVSTMDKELKTILRMRMWGARKSHFSPLNTSQIAIMGKTSERVVMAMEEEAKAQLKDCIERFSLGDIIGKYNKNQLGGNVLTDKHGRPITG